VGILLFLAAAENSPELACSEPVESVEGLHHKIKVPHPAQGFGAGLFIYKML